VFVLVPSFIAFSINNDRVRSNAASCPQRRTAAATAVDNFNTVNQQSQSLVQGMERLHCSCGSSALARTQQSRVTQVLAGRYNFAAPAPLRHT